jgi:WD40 repeat protein
MLTLARWLNVAFAVGGVSLAQPLEVEVARSSLPDKPRFTLSDHKDVVWCVVFSIDGKSLVTCSGDRDAKAGEIRGYDLSSGKPVHKFLVEESRGIRCIAFSPDGKLMATASFDRTVKIWDAP